MSMSWQSDSRKIVSLMMCYNTSFPCVLKGRFEVIVPQLDFIFSVCVVLLGENRVESVFFCDVKKERNWVDLRAKINALNLRTWCALGRRIEYIVSYLNSVIYRFRSRLLVSVFMFREDLDNLVCLWHSFVSLFCNIEVTKIRLDFLCFCLNYFRLYSYSVLFPFSFNINRVDVGFHTNLY